MTEKSYSDIHRELSQIKQELLALREPGRAQAAVPDPDARREPLFDLGFFLLAYLFWLIVVSNTLLISGVAVSQFNCLLAIVPAWATLWLTRGRKPLYALLVALAASAVILLCAHAATLVYDFSWDGNWYHKVDTGLMAWGWNPFRQSMGDFAYQSGLITTKTQWQVWFDGYPKGTYTIGACFYALMHTIEAGKCFNFIGMIALFCIGAPLIRKVANLKAWQAGLVALLVAVNPISVMKAITYYNDGFMAAMLAIFALSLGYLFLHERGRMSAACWVLVFLSLGVGLNVKYSALIFFGILGILFYALLIITRIRRQGMREAGPYVLRVTLLFFAAVVCALAVAGATTYVENLLRYHNPLYSVVGADATPLANQEMPVFLREYPKIVQFFYSIFSRSTNEIYNATGSYFKIPYTIAPEEWAYAAMVDTRAAGWGIVFSGAFAISVLVCAAALAVLLQNREKRRYFWLLALVTAYLLLPPIFIDGLWWGRYYIQLFWLPACALCILFSCFNQARRNGKRARSAGAALAAAAIVLTLLFNLAPCVTYYREQIDSTDGMRTDLDKMKALHGVYTYRLDYFHSEFYGILFNVIDDGVDYVLDATGEQYNVPYSPIFYSFVVCHAVSKDDGRADTASAFLASLKDLPEDRCVLIAVADEGSRGLDEETLRGMRGLGLVFDMVDRFRYSYLAVIDSGTVLYEQASQARLEYGFTVNGHTIELVSAGYEVGSQAQIIIDGVDVSLDQRGLNIAVYDTAAGVVTDIAAIDTFYDNSLSR